MLTWIKNHKLTTLLTVVVAYFLLDMFLGVNVLRLITPSNRLASPTMDSFSEVQMAPSFGTSSIYPSTYSPKGVAADVPVAERLVAQSSNLSLLVKDVVQTGQEIVKHSEASGGFMVQTSYNRPNESAFATITVRVPSDKLNTTLDYFRSQAIKVINENLVGTDLTDEYVDIESRLVSLEKVKTKFESILDSAVAVQDILTVQRELINTQSQIDSLKGQKQALEENANYAKLTIYLSTDELSLPYTPDTKFRPDVVFKLAVRSMLNSLRVVGEALIWVIVYALIWVPVLVVVIAFKKWRSKREKLFHTT